MELYRISGSDRQALWNILQKYLYELSGFYDLSLDQEGNYKYRYFDDYFLEPERRAYFIINEGVRAGFAMIHPYSETKDVIDYVMGEFAVFPAYRRQHLAAEAVSMLWDQFPGRWQIKYSEKNKPAASFWSGVTRPYRPFVTRNGEETLLLFDIRKDQRDAVL